MMFELVRFGCGEGQPCSFDCGGPQSCRLVFHGDLEGAIQLARERIADDPLSIVEVRKDGDHVCTVARDWISHHLTAAVDADIPSAH